ncbi:MAG TPA: hypothetical protein VGR40_01195, partial [Candidatus Binatus sp.]|nr:hypothetical protein [Candidatus Binatus sp.]
RRLTIVNQPTETSAAMRASVTTAMIAIIFGVVSMMPALAAWAAQPRAAQLAAEPSAPAPAGDAADADDKDVPTSQVDKYISVYESMQKDHSLTVEQAALKQGLTVAQFRNLENKIENDDTLRERVRKALRHEVNPSDKESAD